MEKGIKRKIKYALFNYPKLCESAVISTVDWAESNMAVDYSKVSVQSSAGNGKETQLCKVIDSNLESLRWCYVIEKVLEHYHFEKDKVKFIQLHFFQKKNESITCLEVGICRATMFNWQEEIIETAYKWAEELKVL
mgnify:CR=1 FL=1